jgi:hypothetical protein
MGGPDPAPRPSVPCGLPPSAKHGPFSPTHGISSEETRDDARMASPSGPSALLDALGRLSSDLAEVRLDLEVPGAARARTARNAVVDQIDDYLLPRLRQMEAPLLMVVGGSTGACKATLVNSLVGESVSAPGVLRPTTRAPVLACNPADRHWFEGDRILPGLSRTVGAPAGPGGLQLALTPALPSGLALLDSPDIDSVVEANRDLSRQLLAAADAWLFVTTAARYADAVPWDLLHGARDRGAALSIVLDRVAPDVVDEVFLHLREMLGERGLGEAPLLVVPETRLDDGRLPPPALGAVRSWLDGLAADAGARSALVSRTLAGTLDSLPGRVGEVEATLTEQEEAAERLRRAVRDAYELGLREVDEAMRSGSLLRGEVLARWHDVVGTGDVMRAVESRVSWVRDRVRSFMTGKPPADVELRTAVEAGVETLVHAAADGSAQRSETAWRAEPAGLALLSGGSRLHAASPALVEATRGQVREWQGHVTELVRREGAGRRATARLASFGVNGLGLAVMLAVFLNTGGLTGGEVVVAGGTSAVGQKLLEAIFGDQAVRDLAAKARTDLLGRVRVLLASEAARFDALVDVAAPTKGSARALHDAVGAVRRAR